MRRGGQYKWLIVCEGSSDVSTYEALLSRYGVKAEDFVLIHASGKGFVCNLATWKDIKVPKAANASLYHIVMNDIGRRGFMGIILLVDSDDSDDDTFSGYRRCSRFQYTVPRDAEPVDMGDFWCIDEINGIAPIPVYGISAPIDSSGCIETDLLATYGFPVQGQKEYDDFVEIIKKASKKWGIPVMGDGNEWYEANARAKLDKFIYAALTHGFDVVNRKPKLPHEPVVIQTIKKVMKLNAH